MTQPSPTPTAAPDLAALQALLTQVFAPWVQQLNLQVRAWQPAGQPGGEAGGQASDTLVLALPVGAAHVHGGGVVCGQTLMAAADTAMVVAVAAKLGGFRPMTTVQLQSSFLRPVPGHTPEVRVLARLLKTGRQLVFGEIECQLPDGQLAMHATTTYALL